MLPVHIPVQKFIQFLPGKAQVYAQPGFYIGHFGDHPPQGLGAGPQQDAGGGIAVGLAVAGLKVKGDVLPVAAGLQVEQREAVVLLPRGGIFTAAALERLKSLHFTSTRL